MATRSGGGKGSKIKRRTNASRREPEWNPSMETPF